MTSFGRTCRDAWPLDPALAYLNHGTVGVTPRAVLEEQARWRDRIEANPARFQLRELTGIGDVSRDVPWLREAGAAVASVLGARADDLVFVDNTTTGINAILRSFPFEPGETLAVTSLTYGAVRTVAGWVAAQRGLRLHRIDLPFPVADPAEMIEAFAAGLPDEARVVVLDHVVSSFGVVLPIDHLARICRERGVLLLVDGAHAPGMLDVDIEALGATWYVGNLHKWAWTPRSSAVLWCHPDQQAHLRPAVISWGHDVGFHEAFDMPGTRDPTPHLCAPFAWAHRASYGVEEVRAYDHGLAWSAAEQLARAWDTAVGMPRSMVGAMVAVRLPSGLHSSNDAALAVRRALASEGIEVHVAPGPDGLYVRVAVQIYVDTDDIDRLEAAVRRLT